MDIQLATRTGVVVTAEIRDSDGGRGGEVVVRQVDTSDLASVRKFATEILETEKVLHVLVATSSLFLV